MNKRTCLFLYLLISSPSFAQEHKQPRPIHPSHEMEFNITPNEIHLTIDVSDRPDAPEPHTPVDIKKLKIKTAAITAIITALIGAGVSIYLGVHNCN
jgi:hypothetical protein